MYWFALYYTLEEVLHILFGVKYWHVARQVTSLNLPQSEEASHRLFVQSSVLLWSMIAFVLVVNACYVFVPTLKTRAGSIILALAFLIPLYFVVILQVDAFWKMYKTKMTLHWREILI